MTARCKLAAAAIALMVVAAGCSTATEEREVGPVTGDRSEPPTVGELVQADTARRPDGDATAAATAIQAFGVDYSAAVADASENPVFSPTSIAMAFAQAHEGARERTAQQIADVLHLQGDDPLGAFGALDATVARDRAPTVALANRLYPANGLAVREAFLEALARDLGTGVETVDYTRPDAARATINDWVAQQTRDRIPELLPHAAVDANTLLVLVNALYFKGEWAQAFGKYPTEEATFTRTDGSTVQVPFMQELEGNVYRRRRRLAGGRQAVRGGWVRARGARRRRGRDVTGLLTPEVLDAVDAGLAPAAVDFRLPRFDFRTDTEHTAALRSLGMSAPFEAGRADFSGLFADADPWIGAAVHAADISVDEEGTEAAAATGLEFEASGPPPPEHKVIADRSFAFVLRHSDTGAILFAGHVADSPVRSARRRWRSARRW